jgi:hypothetical protein
MFPDSSRAPSVHTDGCNRSANSEVRAVARSRQRPPAKTAGGAVVPRTGWPLNSAPQLSLHGPERGCGCRCTANRETAEPLHHYHARAIEIPVENRTAQPASGTYETDFLVDYLSGPISVRDGLRVADFRTQLRQAQPALFGGKCGSGNVDERYLRVKTDERFFCDSTFWGFLRD